MKKKAKRSFHSVLFETRPVMLKAWAVILIDVLLTGIILVVFAYFDHVRPRPGVTGSIYRPSATATPAPAGSSDTVQQTPDETPVSEGSGEFAIFDFEGVFTDGEVITTENSYRSANISVTLSHRTASSPRKQSIYVEDIYVRSVEYIRALFARDTYGDNIYEKFMSMAERSNSVCSINTDFYGYANRPYGLVIRNGVLYRDTPSEEKSILVLYKDGTVEMFPAGVTPDGQELIDKGAWQGMCFGPILLENGQMMESYKDVGRDPRTIFGMVEPGHYVFVVIDGRQDDYAVGYNYKGEAILMEDLNCQAAFNLDGGGTSQMSFGYDLTNHPFDNGRSTSDILFVGELGCEEPYKQ